MNKLNIIVFTDNEIVSNFCRDYWQIDENLKFENNVKLLAKDAELSQKQFLELVNDECDAQSAEIFCQSCNVPFIFKNRNDFLETQRRLIWYSQNWLCENCLNKRKIQEEQEKLIAKNNFRQLISQNYSSNSAEIDLEGLTLDDAVYLLSFIRFCSNEELTLAKPLSSVNFNESLSPQSSFDYEILTHLYRRGITKVHPESPEDSFTGERAESFYPVKVAWILPVLPDSDHPKYLVDQLEEMFRLNSFPKEWINETKILWKKIALNECLQYLENSLAEHNLTLTPGEKTILVINNLLEDYSVAQIFNMIWRSAKDAAAFLVRKNVPKQHAANTVVGAMQRYGENAKIQGWEVKPYKRPFSCPQSALSQVFFDSVLKIGEIGFNRVPFATNFEDLSDISEIDSVQ